MINIDKSFTEENATQLLDELMWICIERMGNFPEQTKKIDKRTWEHLLCYKPSEVGVQPEVIKNFGGNRSIFGKIKDEIGKPILVLCEINHFKGDTKKKSYTVIEIEHLDYPKYYNRKSWKAIINLVAKKLAKISL